MSKRKFEVSSLCILDNDLRLNFRNLKADEENKTLHFGQRKLGMVLFESLLEAKKIFGSDDFAVLIVGAAPGRNTYAVAKLMKPKKGYFLYDPAGFDISKEEAEETNIHIYKELFTDSIANKWRDLIAKGTNVLFLSDIRSDIPKAMSKVDHIRNEKIIYEDMLFQQILVIKLGAGLSVIKLRFYFANDAKDLGLPLFAEYLIKT